MSNADNLARKYTEEAIQTLAEIMRDGFAKDSDRIKAADSILDRGHGKPLAATISLPASKMQLQALAAMEDEELLTIIRGKPLPRLSGPPAIDADYAELVDEPMSERDPLLD